MTGGSTNNQHMMQALQLARRGQGLCAPNPAVGCVITDAGGDVVGAGWTQNGGRPHAESMALAQAGERAKGGSVYATLEPCAHQGQTPPCARALIEAGVAQVFYAEKDPDPRVAGKGAAMLAEAGIATQETNIAAIATHNFGFFKRLSQARPMTTLKLAVSANGFMRTAAGQSPWITGAPARDYGHILRATHDAIMCGAGTVAADNPRLDCRLAGMAAQSPLPVIMAHNGIAGDSALANRAETEKVILYCEDAPANTDFETRPLSSLTPEGALTPEAVLHDLATHYKVNAVLLECGVRLARSFMQAGLVDSVALFRAPHDVSPPDISQENLSDLDYIGWHEADYALHETLQLGDDHFTLWHKK